MPVISDNLEGYEVSLRSAVCLFVLSSTIAILVGCGDSTDKPQVAPVKGKLIKNGAAVPYATVEFIPENGAPSTGTTDEAGEFELVYVDGTKGAKVGTHQVRVTVGGNAMGSADDAAPQPATQATPPAPPVLYILPQPANVKAGENEVSLDLPESGLIG